MPVQKQLIEIPLSAGLDEGNDPRRTPKFLQALNYVWNKRGRLEKRAGATIVPLTIAPNVPSSPIASISVVSGGSGYPFTGSFVEISASSGGGATALGVASSSAGSVTSVAVSVPGYGFTSPPPPSAFFFVSGSGAGAVLSATLGPAVTGGSITTVYTVASVPNFTALQITDGKNVYQTSENGLAALGPMPAISTQTIPTSINIQAVFSANDTTDPYNGPIDPFVVGLTRYGGSSLNTLVWWPNGGSVIQDLASGTILQPSSDFFGASAFGVAGGMNVVTDGAQYVWQFVNQSGTIEFNYIDMSTPATPRSFGTFAFGSGINAVTMDCAWDAPRNRLVLAYYQSGASAIRVQDWTWVPSSQNFTGPVSVNETPGVTVAGGSFVIGTIGLGIGAAGDIYLGWSYRDLGLGGSGTTNVMTTCLQYPLGFANGRAQVYSANTTNVTDGVLNVSVAETSGGADWHVAFTGYDFIQYDFVGGSHIATAFSSNVVRSYRVPIGGSLATAATATVGTTLLSRLYSQGGDPHALIYSNAGISELVMDLAGTQAVTAPTTFVRTPAQSLALINPRVATVDANSVNGNQLNLPVRSGGTLATPVSIGANQWLLPSTRAPEPGESSIMNLQQLRVTYDTATSPPADEANALLYPGGVPSTVGNVSVRAAAFLHPPTIAWLQFGSTGGSLAAGDYSFIATYARLNDDGSITESAPSLPITGAATANQFAYVYTTTYGLEGSSATQPVFLCIYRTLVDQGGTYYLQRADPFTNYNYPTQMNETGTPGVVTVCFGPDSLVNESPRLYTDGGVFANVSPSACSIAARVRDRIYLGGSPDGFTVYYSDPVFNTGAANFHDEQTIVVSDDGPVTGIAPLDSNTLLFKERAIYVVYGSEGNNTGANNTLSVPAKLPTGNVGCIAPNSPVVVPHGVMFQSHRGIELIDRSLSLTFIGEAVKDETSSRTITAALLVPEQYHIRFFCDDGLVLVYSLLANEWTTFIYDYIGTQPPTPSEPVTSACMWNGVPTWCGVSTVYTETPGSYLDPNTFSVRGSLWTGWFNLRNTLEGYLRIRAFQLLGQWFGETGLNIYTYFDYAAASNPSHGFQWPYIAITNIPGFDQQRLQLEMMPLVQKVEAISLRIDDMGNADITAGIPTQGLGPESITFEVVVKAGRYRGLPAGAKE